MKLPHGIKMAYARVTFGSALMLGLHGAYEGARCVILAPLINEAINYPKGILGLTEMQVSGFGGRAARELMDKLTREKKLKNLFPSS